MVNEQELFLETFYTYGSKYKEFSKEKMNNKVFDEVQEMRDVLLSSNGNSASEFNIDSSHWFKTITKKINVLKEIDDYLIKDANSEIISLINEEKVELHLLQLHYY